MPDKTMRGPASQSAQTAATRALAPYEQWIDGLCRKFRYPSVPPIRQDPLICHLMRLWRSRKAHDRLGGQIEKTNRVTYRGNGA